MAGLEEPVWQPRFPQIVFSGESRKSRYSNKTGNRKGMWKSIFALCHTDSGIPALPPIQASSWIAGLVVFPISVACIGLFYVVRFSLQRFAHN
jgi:hypothetical protein